MHVFRCQHPGKKIVAVQRFHNLMRVASGTVREHNFLSGELLQPSAQLIFVRPRLHQGGHRETVRRRQKFFRSNAVVLRKSQECRPVLRPIMFLQALSFGHRHAQTIRHKVTHCGMNRIKHPGRRAVKRVVHVKNPKFRRPDRTNGVRQLQIRRKQGKNPEEIQIGRIVSQATTTLLSIHRPLSRNF